MSESLSGLRRGERKKNAEKMYTSIAAEQLTNKFGAVIKKHLPHQRGQRPNRPAKKLKIDSPDVQVAGLGMDNESQADADDGDYNELLVESSEDGDTEIEEAQPSNAEVLSFMVLPIFTYLV